MFISPFSPGASRSSERIPRPPIASLLAKLKELPETHRSCEQSFGLISYVLEQFERLSNVRCDWELVRAAHAARLSFRHLGIGTHEFVEGRSGELYASVAARFFCKEGFGAFADFITIYQAAMRVSDSTSLEETAYLLSGYIVVGSYSERTGWKHSIIDPKDVLELRKAQSQNLAFTHLLAYEYETTVLPSVVRLQSAGISLPRLEGCGL